MARGLLSCILLVLLGSAGLLAISAQDVEDSSDIEDEEVFEEERAFLIVRKYAAHQEVVKGSNTTVTIELYNAGNRWERHLQFHCCHAAVTKAACATMAELSFTCIQYCCKG